VFPTTVWTTIQGAGEHDEQALEHFARSYREPVLRSIQGRGLVDDGEHLCQQVVLRVLSSGALKRALAGRGRFRSPVLSVATHVIQDWQRKRRDQPVGELEPFERDPDPDSDHAWALFLAERAMAHLRERGSPYHGVLAGHLEGRPQNRNKLWIARRKLAALIRDEIVQTCSSPEAFEDEVACLSQHLQPRPAESSESDRKS
jgi:hypothetical protein